MSFADVPWAELLAFAERGNEVLRKFSSYVVVFTFGGVAWQLFSSWRGSRRVGIYAVNADCPAPKERMEIARVPRRLVSRAELNGLIGQLAGEERLDLRRFKFDYKFGRQIEIELPEESYRRAKAALLSERCASEIGLSSKASHRAESTAVN